MADGSPTVPMTHTERRVYSLLEREGPLSTREIARRLGLSTSMVRVALRRLIAEGVVSHRPDLEDARITVYFVRRKKRRDGH